MAKLEVKDYIEIGSGVPHDASSWQVAKDPEFKKIIDESLNDKINVKSWFTPLPKLKEDGEGYYADMDNLYARVKIHLGITESAWLTVGPKSQNTQKVIITQKGQADKETTSEDINMQ